MLKEKIGFIGAGRMAESLIKGILRAGLADADCIFAADPSEKRREAMNPVLGENVRAANSEVADSCTILVLAVKPDILPPVADEISSCLKKEHLLISIAPGIALKWLEKAFGAGRIIRAMPNTPAVLGRGATAFCSGSGCAEADNETARALFSSVGLCIQVREELMDAVTGLSGSGPAYAFMIIQALSDGGVKMGLPRDDAEKLAAQTVLGAAEMVLSTGLHPEKLKDMVATPGGTTIAGVHALERAGLRNAMISAVEAAAERSRGLSRDI